MKTKFVLVNVWDYTKNKFHIGTAKKYRDSMAEIGKGDWMNLSVDIKLTEEQIKAIEEQTRIEVGNAISTGKLDSYIKEVVKSYVKSIVNEEIQSKGYRKYIAEKVSKTLMSEDIINE